MDTADYTSEVPAAAQAVLNYWFGEPPLQPRNKLWWQGGKSVDAEIESRFGDQVEKALSGWLEDWAATPRGMLALILLLDQFTRNIHRGTARAFAGDQHAQDLLRQGLAAGFDQSLHPLERSFFYMPLQHAESLPLQEQGVALYQRLAESESDHRKALASSLDFAHKHHVIIARFGRFPHRNEALDRTSTAEETQYLEAGAQRFGQ